jgi:protein-S-isoprenylcysteine O-methyltransferase Ste14
MKNILKIKPNYIIGLILLIQLALHIYGDFFELKSIYSSIAIISIGSIIAALGLFLHMLCHRYHKEGHKTANDVHTIVTSGIFSKIRHPMYLSIMMISWGLYIAWNFIVTIPVPVCLSILLFYIAKKEERYLLEKFSNSYEEYQNSVKWMFIPCVL